MNHEEALKAIAGMKLDGDPARLLALCVGIAKEALDPEPTGGVVHGSDMWSMDVQKPEPEVSPDFMPTALEQHGWVKMARGWHHPTLLGFIVTDAAGWRYYPKGGVPPTDNAGPDKLVDFLYNLQRMALTGHRGPECWCGARVQGRGRI